jgi:hypothetical protein
VLCGEDPLNCPNVTNLDDTPSCSHSFDGATKVMMADDRSKRIDQVKVGDKFADALPSEPLGTKDQTHIVTAVHVTHTDHDYTDVTIRTPHGQAAITGTANHPYWDATTHKWTPANHLHVGDNLQTSSGALVTVVALRDYTTTMATYDLAIDNLHDYYVNVGATPVLVHNCGSLNVTASNPSPSELRAAQYIGPPRVRWSR